MLPPFSSRHLYFDYESGRRYGGLADRDDITISSKISLDVMRHTYRTANTNILIYAEAILKSTRLYHCHGKAIIKDYVSEELHMMVEEEHYFGGSEEEDSNYEYAGESVVYDVQGEGDPSSTTVVEIIDKYLGNNDCDHGSGNDDDE